VPNAIVLHQLGGPDNFRWEPVAVGGPGPGEARIRHTFSGLNYVDTIFVAATIRPDNCRP
jgi:NADPH2:quinone reductase